MIKKTNLVISFSLKHCVSFMRSQGTLLEIQPVVNFKLNK